MAEAQHEEANALGPFICSVCELQSEDPTLRADTPNSKFFWICEHCGFGNEIVSEAEANYYTEEAWARMKIK